MSWTTLISVEELALILDHCVVVDCRHQLTDPKGGLRAYLEGHIPSAHFLSMDDDLSGPSNPALGRHPLPDRDTLRQRLQSLGLSDNTQLVVYDDQGGAMAGRLWMLARWIGHRNVAMLDGGIDAWQRAGYPLSTELRKPTPGRLTNRNPLVGMLSTDELMVELENDAVQIVDARAADRFSGENGAMDPVAGHIPGAINRPLTQNLRPDGRFKPAEVLRQEWEALLAGRSPEHIVHQCGSGVTANHNLLAMEIAGLTGSRVYPPSWSGWIHDRNRPVARGT
ncbi:MAG: sulfurtransferase [Lautropia sp.]|nr:sulfurtransferase [Lautropia sp.]